METTNEFLKNKVVNCQTEEEAKEFFKYLIKKRYKWISGENILINDNEWNVHKDKTCYHIYTYEREGFITYAHISYYKKRCLEIITFQQFKQLIIK